MMYPKLAFENIRKNSRTYLPYIITCIFTVAMYYIMRSLSLNEDLQNVFGGWTTAYILKLGSNVISIFAFIFLFYTNSFLTKNRKKEFGLINILGMEKRHIARMIGYESLYTSIVSLALGIGTGILLDKLMYVALSRIMGVEIKLGFYISTESVKTTLIIFAVLFLLIYLNSLRLIHLSKPIELLKGGSVGEKEPKAKWFAALLGIGCIGGGYYISLTIKNPLAALTLFFVAVILVIVGTYLVFGAGSITLLKLLKRNKKYYYKTEHFISVSGMMYRMKQNAVGLANICILSTMVLVMVSSTSSLMVGIEGIMRERYPHQIELSKRGGQSEDIPAVREKVQKAAAKNGLEVSDEAHYSSINFQMIVDGQTLRCGDESDDFKSLENVCNVFAITAEDYKEYTGKEAAVAENEVILWQNGDIDNRYKENTFTMFDKEYKIVGRTKKFVDNIAVNEQVCPTFGIVVADMDIIHELYESQKEFYGKNASEMLWYYGVNVGGGEADEIKFADSLENVFHKNGISIDSRAVQKKETYSLFGSLFFIGIFLGLLFTMATVLIIYYKQISEGYDDKNRFEIMQKVGMSESEVKGSIRSQVLTVFFLPLITAGIHTAFAFPILCKILAMLQLTDKKLFAISSVCVFLAFAVVYAVIYFLTARVYYKIVKHS